MFIPCGPDKVKRPVKEKGTAYYKKNLSYKVWNLNTITIKI